MTKLQKNTITVLERLIEQVKDMDKESAKIFAEHFETMLDDLRGNDFFGTEGQHDPRGDATEARWTLRNIQ
jgi:hypothetical protein